MAIVDTLQFLAKKCVQQNMEYHKTYVACFSKDLLDNLKLNVCWMCRKMTCSFYLKGICGHCNILQERNLPYISDATIDETEYIVTWGINDEQFKFFQTFFLECQTPDELEELIHLIIILWKKYFNQKMQRFLTCKQVLELWEKTNLKKYGEIIMHSLFSLVINSSVIPLTINYPPPEGGTENETNQNAFIFYNNRRFNNDRILYNTDDFY